jgi:hypothetical protein
VLPHLARLTRRVPVAGPDALAVAVYADATGRSRVARESGFEGVACVDDVARLLDVVCDVWTVTQIGWVERWARGLLSFVLWMQEPDGRWLNFITNWDGDRNRKGITSETGENFWHARALAGVASAWLTFGDERAREALWLGLDHAMTKPAPADVRAIHLELAGRLIAAGTTELREPARRWAEELATCRRGDVLKNSDEEVGPPHLWAHIQEGALASAASLLAEPAFLDVAVRSADALVVPAVRDGFPMPGTSPYDVASCVWSLDRLQTATGDDRWSVLATEARAWFDGRNPARSPVFDPRRGSVADGIDGTRVSGNSGAESNIVAAIALFPRTLEQARALEDPLGSPPPDPGPPD